jgi:hypothetical protein
MREDFPTLERPIKANSGLSGGGHCESFALLFMNVADRIIMLKIPSSNGLKRQG